MVDFIGMSDPEYKAKIAKEADKNQKEADKNQKEYQELLKDATKSPRLNPWEEEFINSLLHPPYFSFYKDTGIPFNKLTKKQLVVLSKIKKKIYAT